MLRFEGLEEAEEREMATRRAWEGHPRWIFISGTNGLEDSITKVISIIERSIEVA
jgi:hypothetical protein